MPEVGRLCNFTNGHISVGRGAENCATFPLVWVHGSHIANGNHVEPFKKSMILFKIKKWNYPFHWTQILDILYL